MLRTPLISKLRLAAEQLEQQRERPGSEPKPQVRERPSPKPWQWATLIVGPLALCRIVVETITKQLDRQREHPGSEPKPQVRERLSSRPWKWATLTVGILALLGLAGWHNIKHLGGMQNSVKYYVAKMAKVELQVKTVENWFQQQIRIFRTYPHLDRAYRLLDRKALEEARGELAAALTLDSHDPQARLSYVMLLYRLQEYQELIHQADLLVSTDPGFASALLYKGLAHQALGETETAMADFDAVANHASVQESDRFFALNMVADLAIKQKRYPEALAALERLPTDRRDFTWYLRQGVVLQGFNRLEDADAAYQQAFSLARGDEEKEYALRALGDISQKRQNWEHAHKAFAAALALKPQDPDLLRALATTAYVQSDWAETARCLQQLRTAGSATRQDREWLSQVLQKSKDYHAAAAELASLLAELEAPEERHRVAMALGALYSEAAQFSEASRAFEEAAHIKRDLPTLAALAQVYAQSGRWPQTTAILQETLQEPQDPETHLQLGLLAAQAGDEATTLQHLEFAIAGPLPAERKVLAYKQQGYLHHKVKRYAQARQAFAAALALQPQDAVVLRAMAETAYAQEAFPDTAHWLQQLGALGQATLQDRERLAQVFHMMHQDQKAVDEYVPLLTKLQASTDRHRVSMTLGYLYFDLGKFRDAASAFHKAALLKPDLPTVLALAQTYERIGALAEAITTLQSALRFDQSGELHFKLGVLHDKAGEQQKALHHFNLALKGNLPSDKKTLIYRQQGELYYQLRRYAEAREALEKAVALSPQDPDLYAALGQTCLQLAAIPEAIASLQRSAALRETPTILQNLVFAYKQSQRWEDAVATTRRLLTLEELSASQRGEAFANLGMLYSQLGQDEKAVNAFREAIALGCMAERFQLGFTLAKLGRWSEALTEFRFVHNQKPTPQSALAMGRTYAALGKTGLAIPYLQEARQHKDALTEAEQKQLYTEMGALYAEESDYLHATKTWEQALTLGASPELTLQLGHSQRLSGQISTAQRTLEALSSETLSPALEVQRLDELAYLYTQTKQAEKAIAVLTQANTLQQTADRQFRLGQAYQTLHRTNEALVHFQTAVTLEPQNNLYVLTLAYAYKEAKQTDAAFRLFETALERAPDNVSLYKELAYFHMHNGQNDEAVRRFRQGIDQALAHLQVAQRDTRTRNRNINQRRSEVQRLTNRPELTLAAATSSPPRRFQGTFIQLLRTHGEWQPQDWTTLFRYLKELQLSHIVIQWTVYDDLAFYPTPGGPQTPNPPLETILRLADEAAIAVYVGLVYEPKYWEQIRQPLPQVEKYLGRLRSHSVSVASQLLPIVQQHPSFQGWYIPEEIDDTTWRASDFRAALYTHLNRLSAYLHTLTPTKKVAVSGFANGRLEPQAFESFWSGLLAGAAIDVVLFQDGIGARKQELPELAFYLTAIRNATQAHHRELKIIIEIFEQVAGPPLDDQPFQATPAVLGRIRHQIETSAAYASGLVAFSIPEYMTPLGGPAAEHLFATYKKEVLMPPQE